MPRGALLALAAAAAAADGDVDYVLVPGDKGTGSADAAGVRAARQRESAHADEVAYGDAVRILLPDPPSASTAVWEVDAVRIRGEPVGWLCRAIAGAARAVSSTWLAPRVTVTVTASPRGNATAEPPPPAAERSKLCAAGSCAVGVGALLRGAGAAVTVRNDRLCAHKLDVTALYVACSADDCGGEARALNVSVSRGRCVCAACQNQWTGADCKTCASPFAGSACDQCMLGMVGYPACNAPLGAAAATDLLSSPHALLAVICGGALYMAFLKASGGRPPLAALSKNRDPDRRGAEPAPIPAPAPPAAPPPSLPRPLPEPLSRDEQVKAQEMYAVEEVETAYHIDARRQ